MKLSVTKFSIEHLVATGCTDIIVEGIKELEAENARLKAEIERLTVEADWKTPARKIKALEADVERLNATMEKVISTADKIDEQNQRLRKAGDEMADLFVPDIDDLGHNYGFKKSVEGVILNWNAAKEGKPSV